VHVPPEQPASTAWVASHERPHAPQLAIVSIGPQSAPPSVASADASWDEGDSSSALASALASRAASGLGADTALSSPAGSMTPSVVASRDSPGVIESASRSPGVAGLQSSLHGE
jgi:hypothetical protein